MIIKYITPLLAAFLCCQSPSLQAQTASDGSLYLMPENVYFGAYATAMSSHAGNTVGGYATNEGTAPLIWNEIIGLQPLHPITQAGGIAMSISGDGTVMGGILNARAYRWVIQGESDYLYDNGNAFLGEVSAVSGNGQVLAGVRNDGQGNNAPYTWTEEGGVVALPMADGYINAEILTISYDGSVIGGSISNALAERVPVLWINGELRLIEVENDNFARVVDMLPDASYALIDTTMFVAPAFVYNIETQERFPLATGDSVNSFCGVFGEGATLESLTIVGRRNLGTQQQGRYTVFAWDMDTEGNIVEEVNLEDELITRFDLNPETTRFSQVLAIRAEEQFLLGRLTLNTETFYFVLDLEGDLGVVNQLLPDEDSQGARFAELIDTSPQYNGWVVESWFDAFNFVQYDATQWIYHQYLAWLYVPEIPGSTDGFWFYSNSAEQWIYTDEINYPWVYYATLNQWLYTN